MNVQSLRLSSIIFLFPLMFFLGGCNYLEKEKCKHGDMLSCENVCKDKETCTKACGEGNIYACAFVCDENNQFACTKACFDIDHDDIRRKSACMSLCWDNDWNACDVLFNVGDWYIDYSDALILCTKGSESACNSLCFHEEYDEEHPVDRGVCKMLCDTTYYCSLHNHDERFHKNGCERVKSIKKKQEEEQAQQQAQERKRREEIYQKSPRGRCEKTCNQTYQAYSESWKYCMSACSQMRSDIVGW